MRLVVDISGHGLGHLTQIAPVVRALRERRPALTFVVRSSFSRELVEKNLGPVHAVAEPPPDIGLIMRGPHVPDLAATADCYRDLHADITAVAKAQARVLARLGADALLSDVGYTGLLGGQHRGLPTASVCSLNWAEVLAAYFGDRPEFQTMVDEIALAYNAARVFVVAGPRRQPGFVRNGLRVAPLVRTWGRQRREDIGAKVGAAKGTRVGLVSFGGVGHGLPQVALPDWPGWLWIVPDGLAAAHGVNTLPFGRLPEIDFLDAMASSDLVVTKTGYGTSVECAYYGSACVFLSRADWPEAADLEAWLVARGTGAPATAGDLRDGSWAEVGRALLHGDRTPLRSTGEAEAAEVLIRHLEIA